MIATRQTTSLSEAYQLSDFSDNYSHASTTPTPLLKGPKRARVYPTNAGNCAKVCLPKKGRGCLSELPVMPMDILFEIFGHLHPSDLLSLCRVNKGFRSVLVSPCSSFLWNACFKLCGAPPSPVDMSPPAWAHLLFGGAYCYSCGTKPITRILFSLRRRACKPCTITHMSCSLKVPQEYEDMIRGYYGSSIHKSRCSCTRHWWDEDVAAFQAEITALKSHTRSPNGDAEAAVSEFLVRKKKEVSAIAEHALICAAWEKGRNEDRSNTLSDVKAKRFEDIKARFLPLGYSEEDVNQLRQHREVKASKPMSDRVWQRVGPLLRPGVNEARDQRLIREGQDGYCRRRLLALTEYGNFLKTLPPILLALSPTATQFLCENQALADALARGNDPDHPPLIDLITGAINRLRPALETRKRERAALLRSLLPKSDVRDDATNDEAIALATSIYECSDCRLPTSGLHMLAHNCEYGSKPYAFSPQLSQQGRVTVALLLQFLGLGRETTALELDRRNDRIVCMVCSRGSFRQNGIEVLGRCVRDWRSCVAHATGSRNERWHKDSPKWHLMGTAETAGLTYETFSSTHAYGCLHCPIRINPSTGSFEWYTAVGAVMEHVRIEHGRNKPLEGDDYFFDYRTRRSGCRSLLVMDH